MMESLSSINQEEKQKLSVYNAVSKVCDEVGSNNTYIGKFKVDSDAKVVITELIWKKMEQYAEDLVAFSQHAKRNQINIEDVKLLFRRNEKIAEELSKVDEDETERVGKRKRTSTTDKTEDLSKATNDELEKPTDNVSKRKRTSAAAKAAKKS